MKDLVGKKIAILGFGREGRASLELMRKLVGGEQEIWVLDANTEIEDDSLGNVNWFLGKGYLKRLDEFDVIVRSAGVPYGKELDAVADRVVTGTQLFFDELDPSNKVVAVTGSKGKSTTASLIYEVLRSAGMNAELIGNIGEPVHSHMGAKDTVFVVELSSYQLVDLNFTPDIAVWTSFFPDHLPWHGSLEKYFQAKTHIASGQSKDAVFVYSSKWAMIDEVDTAARRMVDVYEVEGDWIVKGGEKVMNWRRMKLSGHHNAENVCLVLAVADEMGVSRDLAVDVVAGFAGLPHRLEEIGVFGGVLYVDDAISTTPESTLAAMSVYENVGGLILGGEDRGVAFEELAREIVKRRVGVLVFFPDSGPRIWKTIEAIAPPEYEPAVLHTRSMDDAVKFVAEHVSRGVCLLSSASPSYSVFKNFEEKGEEFQRVVEGLGE